ncbi:5-formyltetrahydrofolate cyclo-ligase [Sphingopyxis sp. MWB1]|uniref:5-formyltetrahydrofolate cyclo-ligase n=1 Tax=Sphingopyxis sp. MWB1 TaxID=1537715 RepID=UPI00068C443C|nr:5-formyltetrahydrofolate cyclo-ligase [Sphingopyxis sp. MWB1]
MTLSSPDMGSSDLTQQKQALRDRLRFRRRHFVAGLDGIARLAAFRALPDPVATLVKAHGVIGLYAPWQHEPDILPMFTGLTTTLPYHEARDEHMGFRLWKPGDPLAPGPWHTPQPAENAPSAQPGLIFCPLLGFDRHGGRLGQGGGHYDRYFAAHPDALRVGIAWAVQEVDSVPREATDMALDAILTEQEFIVMGDRI